jgi:predicted GNAT family acetyltransferase
MNDIENLNFRKLDNNDLDIFIKLRFKFLLNEYNIDEMEKDEIENNLRKYFAKNIMTNNFIGIICESGNKIISVAYLHISERIPNQNFINGKIGTLMNVYTFPEYRNRGIATELIKMIIEEAKVENVKMVELAATEAGEKIYKKIGFKESKHKNMRLKL